MRTEASPNDNTKDFNHTTCILEVTTCIKNSDSKSLVDESKQVNEDNHS